MSGWNIKEIVAFLSLCIIHTCCNGVTQVKIGLFYLVVISSTRVTKLYEETNRVFIMYH